MGRTRETSEARQRILDTADRLFYQYAVMQGSPNAADVARDAALKLVAEEKGG